MPIDDILLVESFFIKGSRHRLPLVFSAINQARIEKSKGRTEAADSKYLEAANLLRDQAVFLIKERAERKRQKRKKLNLDLKRLVKLLIWNEKPLLLRLKVIKMKAGEV